MGGGRGMATVPMKRTHQLVLSCAAMLAVSCTSSVRRFPLRDPVWVDEDLRPVNVQCRADADKPKESICAPDDYESVFGWDVADKTVFRPITRFLIADKGFEAKNVNAFDEVPDSSWFTNRIGVRPMSNEDIARGGCFGKTIEDAPHAPGAWLIDKGKANGANAGFRLNIEGVGKFLLKVDDPAEGEKATGATAIATRLYHAAGWWAACDSVVYFDRSWLRLKPGLTYADNSNEVRPFDQKKLDSILDSAQTRNGLVRMSASRWLTGRTIGPFRYEETRDDDPNDIIPHEDRRDLRGARMIAAWLGHFDSREQNTMTTWEPVDGKKPGSSPGHTVHWYIDLGDCFGSKWENESWNRRINYSYYFDPGDVATDFLTLGIIKRPWDDPPHNKELPMFDYFQPTFEPDEWKGGYPNPAFSRMTERDAAWAARIISRFTNEQVATAVAAGDYTDPRASVFLSHALESRRDAIMTRYFSKLSPLADVTVDGSKVCATDLARSHGVYRSQKYAYQAALWTGSELTQKSKVDVAASDDGSVCVTLPRVAKSDGARPDSPERYAVLDVTNGIAHGPLRMHFYDLGADKGFKLVGIERPADGDRDF